MIIELDVLIIGSGAGGGTVADRLRPLAKAGAKIAIAESGPHYTRDYFTQREIEMMGLLWHNGAWPTADGTVTLAAGRTVGGSTTMYTGVSFRLPDEVYDDWNIPGINKEDMTPRFERIEKECNVIEPGPEMINDNNRLFKEGCDKLGWEIEKIKLNLRDCDQNGFCNLGCVKGGKQGTLEVQIPKAVQAGIQLIPNCHIERIEENNAYGVISSTPPGTKDGPYPAGKVEFRARTIVLSAGCPGTPALLMRSSLDGISEVLGRYITIHPALTVYGIYPSPIKNYRGFPKTYYTPRFSKSHHYYIETAFYYPFISTKHLGLWGKKLKDVMRCYPRFMSAIILNHDEAKADNCIILKKGSPVLNYKISRETVRALAHAQAQTARIFFSAGCEKVVMPFAKKPVFGREIADADLENFITEKGYVPNLAPLATAHPQGGAKMGIDPRSSVTDPFGQVHGYTSLYVADASLFPKSSHVNPYMTIMALAERVAEKILEKEKVSSSNPSN